MLKISKLADYATVIMGCLADHLGCSQSANQVSEATHIPLPTVSKILKLLNEAKLVESARGPAGGYQLKIQPEQISIASIITAIDGKPAMTECAQSGSNCSIEHACDFRGNWQKINFYVLDVLEKISLAQMNEPIEQPLRFYGEK